MHRQKGVGPSQALCTIIPIVLDWRHKGIHGHRGILHPCVRIVAQCNNIGILHSFHDQLHKHHKNRPFVRSLVVVAGVDAAIPLLILPKALSSTRLSIHRSLFALSFCGVVPCIWQQQQTQRGRPACSDSFQGSNLHWICLVQ